MATPSEASRRELDRLEQFFRATIEFLRERGALPPAAADAIPSPAAWRDAMAAQPFSEVLAGMRAAANDAVAMLRYFLESATPGSELELEAHLRSHGAASYGQMRRRFWQTVAAVMRRKRIVSDVEHRVVLELLSDVDEGHLSPAERATLEEILHAVESPEPT